MDLNNLCIWCKFIYLLDYKMLFVHFVCLAMSLNQDYGMTKRESVWESTSSLSGM